MTEPNFINELSSAAFAFRGYNVTNLGKSPELLEHEKFGPLVEARLVEASQICSDVLERPVDLVSRVKNRLETTLDSYSDDLGMIVAVELAQLDILRQFFDVKFEDAQLAVGYSLGELTALVACGVYPLRSALEPILSFSVDAAELGKDVQMGIVFSRGPELNYEAVERLCVRITQEGKGTISISSYLSPNTVLVMGQAKTVNTLKSRIKTDFPREIHVRKNPHRWPPMHTTITRHKHISDRVAVKMSTSEGGQVPPRPRLLSCVTGDAGYNDHNSVELLARWVDQPQRLWDVVDEMLATGVESVIHVGPEPNIIPATFGRLVNNIASQLSAKSLSSYGLRAVSHIVRRHRPWLARLMSSDAALLRAPFVQQIILEDWLLEQTV